MLTTIQVLQQSYLSINFKIFPTTQNHYGLHITLMNSVHQGIDEMLKRQMLNSNGQLELCIVRYYLHGHMLQRQRCFKLATASYRNLKLTFL